MTDRTSPRCEWGRGDILSPHGALRAYTVLLTAEPLRGSFLGTIFVCYIQTAPPRGANVCGRASSVTAWRTSCLYGVSHSRTSPMHSNDVTSSVSEKTVPPRGSLLHLPSFSRISWRSELALVRRERHSSIISAARRVICVRASISQFRLFIASRIDSSSAIASLYFSFATGFISFVFNRF